MSLRNTLAGSPDMVGSRRQEADISRAEPLSAPETIGVDAATWWSLMPGEAGFLPTYLLTEQPAPLEAITIEPPDEEPGGQPQQTIATLSIDAQGFVTSVNFSEAQLPLAYQEAIQRAFLAARFTPGKLFDRPVGALVRVEITVGEVAEPSR